MTISMPQKSYVVIETDELFDQHPELEWLSIQEQILELDLFLVDHATPRECRPDLDQHTYRVPFPDFDLPTP
jgi:hypothetical protein